jgi:hypothetical protein
MKLTGLARPSRFRERWRLLLEGLGVEKYAPCGLEAYQCMYTLYHALVLAYHNF